MRKKNRIILGFLLLLLPALSFQNCSKVKFAPGSDEGASSASTQGASCTLNELQRPVKIIFMVDNSPSTDGVYGSDPKKFYRLQLVEKFLANYEGNTKLSYSYSYFSSSALTFEMADNSNFKAGAVKAAFGPPAGLRAALDEFSKISSSGTTYYSPAFATIERLVQSVPEPGSDFVVIFMSDGEPKDNWSKDQQVEKIRNLVKSLIVKAGDGHLTVSAAYFGNVDKVQSVKNLQAMATEGDGVFVDSSVTDFHIEDLISLPQKSCQ